MRAMHRLGFVAGLSAASAAWGQVGAGPGDDAAGVPEAVLAGLDADDPVVRERASRSIESDGSRVSLTSIERTLRRGDLTPEQRRRLLAAAFERFRDPSGRAGMGVAFDFVALENGLRLGTIVPDFPAAAVLRQGDRVLKFDGVSLRDREHAIAMIVARDPGDEVSLGIVRGGEPMTVTVRLGRRDALDNPTPVEGSILAEAWAIRSAAFTAPERSTPIIDGGITRSAWEPADSPGENPSLVVTAGGEGRGGIDPDDPRVVQADQSLIVRVNPRQRGIDGRLILNAQPDANRLLIERQSLAGLADGLQQTLDNLRRELRRQDLTAWGRAQLQSQVDAFALQLQQVRARIDAIDADLRRMGIRVNGGRGGP